MRAFQRLLAFLLAATLLLNSGSYVRACGPEYTTPIFVFTTSPDIPFKEYAAGKIGIVRPTFGRKTLVIAYRFLNGGTFTSDEQDALIAALNGKAPEEGNDDAVKAWIKARTEFLKKDEELPKIYTERRWGSNYDFFPNCASNAFEVALDTLKNRTGTYGAEDRNVANWLAAQDIVFQNCSGGAHIPSEVGAESPSWLRKDRDYQIAAAYFYSLNFAQAREQFEKIAADYDSPWQEIAPYLIGRSFVRQATLQQDEKEKREYFAQAETQLRTVGLGGGRFPKPAQKLLALVKYHLHPEERVVELGHDLAAGNDENLRQDLIDYVWLLDKLEAQILRAEAERKAKLNPNKEPENDIRLDPNSKYALIDRGESIDVTYYPKKPDGTVNYEERIEIFVKYDTPEAEIMREFESKLGRPPTPDEKHEVKTQYESALKHRAWNVSPNRKWEPAGLTSYDSYDGTMTDTKLTRNLIPEYLRADELSDWILTLQVTDPRAYTHAFSMWRQTDSPAWLLVSLIKADTSSSRLRQLMRAAERRPRSDPAYPTLAYHLIRLKVALGETTAARKILDEVIADKLPGMPLSAQNQFLEQRAQLARGMDEFLKSSEKKAVAYYHYGGISTLRRLMEREKDSWNPEYAQGTREEHDQSVEKEFKERLPWDDRVVFDKRTIDIFNWHFPLTSLVEAARNPNVPDYLQRGLALAAWTRAILLRNDKVAMDIAPDVLRLAPEMATEFRQYLNAQTIRERRREALYVLLKHPGLSPYLIDGLPEFPTTEDLDYYFESAWWCKLPDTEYNDNWDEIPKIVPKPTFLTSVQLEAARRERVALGAFADGKSYLGKQVLEWARTSPNDVRLPEALFIAVKANEVYKYGCESWNFDKATRDNAAEILRKRFPYSPWTAKLPADDDN